MNSSASTAAEPALLEAYQDWRRLAELEGEAIRARDWTLMADCQNRLAALQPRIDRVTRRAREEWRGEGIDCAERENHLREIISGLIELEAQNISALTAAKQIARQQLDELDGARQNLKRVQRSYSQASPAVWNSFS